MKKLFVLFTTIILAFSMGLSVQAKAIPLPQTMEFEIATELEDLVNLGIRQEILKPFEAQAFHAAPMMENQIQNTLDVTQVARETTYSDGSKEQEIVLTGLLILDKEGSPVTREALLKSYADEPSSASNIASNYSVSVTLTANLTRRLDTSSGWLFIKHRLNNITTTVYKNGSVSPAYGKQSYMIRTTNGTSQNFNCQQNVSIQSFTKICHDKNFYIIENPPIGGGVYADTRVYLTNGRYIDTYVNISSGFW